MARKKKTSPSLKKKKTGSSKGANQKYKEENEVQAGTGPGLVFEGETEGGQDWQVEASPFGSVEGRLEVAWEGNGELYLVAGVDLSPVDLDVGYNPETGELGLGGAVGVPGDLLGAGGGFTIDTNTGEVIGVNGSVAVAGLEIDLEVSGPGGCRKTLTATYFGVGVSNVIDECSIEPEPEPDPGDEGEGEDGDEIEEQTTPIYRDNPGEIIAICSKASPERKEYLMRFPFKYKRDVFGAWSLTFVKETIRWPVIYWYRFPKLINGEYRRTVRLGTNTKIKTRIRVTYYDKNGNVHHNRTINVLDGSSCSGSTTVRKEYDIPYVGKKTRITWEAYFDQAEVFFRDKDGNISQILPQKPPRPSSSPPPPQPKMNRCNCKEIIEKLDLLLNVNGGSEQTLYPVIVNKTKDDGTIEEIPVYNFLSYLRLKLGEGDSDVLKLLKEMSLVTGKIEQDQERVYPTKLKQVVNNAVKEFEVNNLFELTQAIGNSGGYRKEPTYPIEAEQVVDNEIKKFHIGNSFDHLSAIGNTNGYKEKPVYPVKLEITASKKKFYYGSVGELQADIGRVLAPQKMLHGNDKEGFAISKNLLIPGAEGYDFTKDYLGIYTRQFSAIDNHGFSAPIVAKVQDVNAAKEGDQTVELQVNSLDAAIQTLLELAIENGGDIDTQTNILVRLSYLLSRTFVLLSRVWHRVTAILDGLGVSTNSSVETLDVEFDPFAKKEFKGFGSDSPKGQLDLHEEDTTEKLLPDLLQMSKVDIAVEKAQKGDNLRQKLIQLTHKKK